MQRGGSSIWSRFSAACRGCFLRLVAVVGVLAAQPTLAADEVLPPIESLSLRAWAEEIFNKPKKQGISVGVDLKKEYIGLEWDSGWKPPGGAVITKIEGKLQLWHVEENAGKEFDADLKKAFGDDWRSKWTSPRASVELAEGARGTIGTRLGDSFIYDKKEDRWRPQGIVEAYFHCGGITAQIKVQVRDALLPKPLQIEGATDDQSQQKKPEKPGILKAKESLEAAKKTLDQARTAVKTVIAQLETIFVDRRICKSPEDDEDEYAYLDPKRVRVFIPVFESFGWKPNIFDGETAEDLKKYYPQYNNDPGMQAFMRSDTVEYTEPQGKPLLGGWEGDLFTVSAAGRLSYAENLGNVQLGQYMVEEAFKLNPDSPITPEQAFEIIEGVEPMLAAVGAAGYGPNMILDGETQKTAGAIGELICGEIKVQFGLTRYGPVIPAPEGQAAQEALAKRLVEESLPDLFEVMDELKNRILLFRNAVVDADIPCPTDEEFVKPERDADHRILDANVIFTPGNVPVGSLSIEDLAKLDANRVGAVADGTSLLLLEVEAPEAGSVSFSIVGAATDGALATRDWTYGSDTTSSVTIATVEEDDRHLAYALYVPPAELGGPHGRLAEGVGVRDIQVAVTLPGNSFNIDLMLARPPAVLVHGTFSTPVKWQESSPVLGGLSMVDALAAEGIESFLVDFTKSNGSGRAPSGFVDNAQVVLGPPLSDSGPSKGIRQALDTFRTEHRLAAAKVDVVGHSLGGLLPRVFASPAYEVPGERGYRAAENWDEGDIRRLVTLCSPHFGSDLPGILLELQDLTIAEQTFKDWAVRQTFAAVADYQAGMANNAAANQAPESDALKKIGATDVPSHAVACTMDYEEMTRSLFDDRAREKRNGQYVRDFLLLSSFFGRSPTSLNVFANPLRQLDEDGKLRPTSQLAVPPPAKWFKPEADAEDTNSTAGSGSCTLRPKDATVTMAIDDQERLADILVLIDWQKSQTRWEKAWAASLSYAKWAAGGMRLTAKCTSWKDCLYANMSTISSVGERQLMQLMRAAVFGNTPNDGVVRLESQLGGLEPPHASIIDKVVHGEAPIYGKVQKRVAALLTGPADAFSKNGFPPAGQKPVDLPPGVRDQPARERIMAVSRSNMVPAHAEAISRVAHARNEIVLARPVNADSTPLILAGAGTKSMHVKGKSANWGPHSGYIPVDQAFSKLARTGKPGERLKNSKIYNCEVVKTFTKKNDPDFGKEIARRRPLVLDFDGKKYDVMRVMDTQPLPAHPEVVLWDREAKKFVDWRNRNNSPSVSVSQDNTSPLEVLTPPPDDQGNDLGVYLTADYDLHAIGTRYNRFDDPTAFDKERGFISACQIELVAEINKAVEVQSGYAGGNVVHHGPESQFTASPGNDYPVTIFEPGKLGGWIKTIQEGPPDDPDRHLKAYFLRKNSKTAGWTMPWNPNWNWGEPDWFTGTFKPPQAAKDVPSESDDNDGQTEEKAQCEALPPCESGVAQGDWKVGPNDRPDAIGCWG